MSVPDEYTAIVERLGVAAAKRARRKREGGDNALKGYRFETFVAVVTLLEEAMGWFGQGCPDECATFVYQPLGFVDDLSILSDDCSRFVQIKDVKEEEWGRNEKSLAGDFRSQAALLEGYPGALSLVLILSRQDVADALRDSKPLDLEAVAVMHVAPVKIPKNAWVDPGLSATLGYFLERPNDKTDLVAACSALASAWHDLEGVGTTKDLYEEAVHLSQGKLRSLQQWITMSTEARDAVNGIDELRVEPRGRRLCFWDQEGLRGRHPFLDDATYGQFERLLVAKGPRTVEAFVDLLETYDATWS
ncbi:hypothetical protein [Fulvimarina sp. MAC8]|uniref:hypothetical protein n=1 Tax=Fulvimarina sp. MAC8 TaxID=3162874 RepID=UPI0032EB9AC9